MAARATTTARKTTAAKKTVAVPKKSASVPRSRTAVSRKTGKEVAVEMHAYIPHPSVGEKYVGRQIWGTWDKELADIAMQDAINMLLQGETGAGKTLFGEAYASKLRLPYYSLPCDVAIDTPSLFGRLQPTSKAGSFKWQDGPVTWIFRHGGVLNISEINFMSPKISASLYPALDGRRYLPLLGHEGEIVRAHLGTEGEQPCWCDLKPVECNKRRVLIISDMNPNYRGTMELNAAFKNRFEFKIPWNYDENVENRLVKFPTLRKQAKELRAMQGTEIFTPVSTNMLMEFEKFAMRQGLSLDFATNNFVSAFRPDEQEAVSKQFELNKTNLEKDIAHFIKESRRQQRAGVVDNDDELEEVEVEFEEED